MLHHTALRAAQLNSSLNALRVAQRACERQRMGCAMPSLKELAATENPAPMLATLQAGKRLGDFDPAGMPSASYPYLCTGSRFGAYPAPGGSASFCFDCIASARSRYLPEQVGRQRQRTPLQLLPGPSKKALLGTWEQGTSPASPCVTRAASGNFHETEITTMYQNKVTLIGFLGNDAEVRTNNDRSLTTLSVATKSSYKKDGKYIEHTEWHRCVVFGKLGEFAATLKKGTHIQVEGELRSRKYQPAKVGKKQPEEKTLWEIRVNSILKLDRAAKAAAEDTDDAPEEEAA